MRRVVTLVFVVALCAPLSACGASSGSAQSQVAGLRAAILAAIRAHQSLHYVDVGKGQDVRETTVGDIAKDRGIQRVRIRLFGQPGEYTMLLVDHNVYLRGDDTAFSFFGFPEPSKYVGRWVSLPAGGPLYAAYASDLTLGSFADDHVPRSGLRLVNAGAGLRGTTRVPGVVRAQRVENWIYVRSPRRPLPAKGKTLDLTAPFSDMLTIGRWNEPVNVQAPVHPVPYLRLIQR